MIPFIILILCVSVVVLFVRLGRLKSENQLLEKRIQRIDKTLQSLVVKPESIQKEPEKAAEKKSDIAKPTERITQEGKVEEPKNEAQESFIHEEVNQPPVAASAKPKPALEKTKEPAPTYTSESTLWSKMEKQFIENWTGILGSVIMVTGIVFLGIYAALKLEAFSRFLMIVGCSAALFGGFLFLRRKQQWLRFGLWLRSSAAAVFLFSCFGAGAIEGLQWIYDPTYALVCLMIGISVNLALSWLDGKQVFASIHVLLSLVTLVFVPQGVTTLIIAAVISMVGILLTYREKWDYHLLASVSSFFIFHLFWNTTLGDLTQAQNITGIITVIVISLTTAFVHYRDAYKSQVFDALPFTVHLLNWFYFGLGLMIHSTGSQWKTFIILAGSIGAFFLARRARTLGVSWLYYTDTIIAHITLIIAIVTLNNWGLSTMSILVFTFLETLLFSFIMVIEKQQRLYQVATFCAMGVVVMIAGYAGYELLSDGLSESNYENAFYLLIVFLSTLAFHFYTFIQNKASFSLVDALSPPEKEGEKPVSSLSLFIGLIALLIHFNLFHESWIDMALALITVGLMMAYRRLQSVGVRLSVGFLAIALHMIGWGRVIQLEDSGLVNVLIHSLPLFLVSGLLLLRKSGKTQSPAWPGVYATGGNLALLFYFSFDDGSPFVFGFFLLISTLTYFLTAVLLGSRENRKGLLIQNLELPLSVLAVFSLGLFFIWHLTETMHSEEQFFSVKRRYLLEVFSIIAFGVISSLKAPKTIDKSIVWSRVQPLALEFTVFFYAFTIARELSAFWHPILWVSSAFVFLFLGQRFSERFSRLRFTAIIFYLIAAVQVAFLTSRHVTTSTSWLDQAWLSGSVSIVLLFVFLGVFYRFFDLKNISYPSVIQGMKGLVGLVDQHRHAFLLYSLVGCIAMFLFSAFDRSVLTFLWVVECLIVFILSLVLKEQHFRYVALTGLALCILRLIFFDLSQAGTLTKALVFLGVGVVMLAMNWLYTKYKNRYLDQGEEGEAGN